MEGGVQALGKLAVEGVERDGALFVPGGPFQIAPETLQGERFLQSVDVELLHGLPFGLVGSPTLGY